MHFLLSWEKGVKLANRDVLEQIASKKANDCVEDWEVLILTQHR
jgi:hypothetical protein